MIAFLTQYYRGLGHAMRVKYISDCLPKNSFVMINQLYNPPIKYNTEYSYYLEEIPPKNIDNYKYLLHTDTIRKRAVKAVKILDNHPEIKTLLCEGFPFCRQQFSYEYFYFLEECRKRNIKIIVSVRDYPWDEPHYQSLQDWVAKSINYIIEKFDCDILIHGDEKVLPLMSDITNAYYWSDLLEDIKSRIYYTGYVCNPEVKRHSRKNNEVYISCGLNKEESFYIYNKILRSLVPRFPDLSFIITLGNENLFSKIGNRESSQVKIVNYIPNLSKKLEECTAYITYGGYNSTTDIFKSKIPAIIIPRQDGNKLEQLIRCYKLEPYNLFKVCSYYNLNNIHLYLSDILNKYNSFPESIEIDLEGANNSARFLENI